MFTAHLSASTPRPTTAPTISPLSADTANISRNTPSPLGIKQSPRLPPTRPAWIEQSNVNNDRLIPSSNSQKDEKGGWWKGRRSSEKERD